MAAIQCELKILSLMVIFSLGYLSVTASVIAKGLGSAFAESLARYTPGLRLGVDQLVITMRWKRDGDLRVYHVSRVAIELGIH